MKRKLEYFNGSVYGNSDDGDLAQTVLCFMISSLSSQYRDVVRMVPLNKINVQIVTNTFLEIVDIVEKVGFNVVAVCADNHPVNCSFFKQKLCNGELKPYVNHPVDNTRPLFILFDSTHNFKNLYNNFQKHDVFNFHNSSDFKFASFSHVKHIYELEENKP